MYSDKLHVRIFIDSDLSCKITLLDDVITCIPVLDNTFVLLNLQNWRFFYSEPILSAVTWATENNVVPVWMNRVQNTAKIVSCNARTAVCLEVSFFCWLR